jgi:hypothetical protein
MRTFVIGGIAAAVLALAVVLPLSLQGTGEATDTPRLASVFGVAQVERRDTFVHITVLVPPGRDAGAAVDAALAAQGARRATPQDFQSAEFTTTGLVWDQFSDDNAGNDFVVQYFNPSSVPTDLAAETGLTNTHSTWTAVPTSSFAFSYAGHTTRCPSLVDECSGPQTFDGFNDVAFLSLAGPCNAVFGCTLGVTWFSTTIDEADMALNTKASWSDTCASVSGRIDVETVLLHENGHVGGLGHTDVQNAVMFASYQGARCTLHQDDIDGISSLYPGEDGPTATPVNTATPGPSATPTDTPTLGPTATPTNTPAPFCPPGHQRRGIC